MVQQRLLDIAIDVFGEHGPDGASTREIAAAANTAMSSITYHYGGKEGLYLAAADEVAKQMGDPQGVEELQRVVERSDPVEARVALFDLVRRFLRRLQHERSNSWALFVMREQLNPTPAFERIYAGPMGHTARALADLIAIATGVQDREAVQLAALSLMGQVLVMKAARATCHKLLERDALSPELLETYAARIIANTDAMLDRMIAERQEQA